MCSVQQSRDGEEVIRHRTWGAAVVGAESRPLPRLGCAGWARGELGSPGEVQGWCDQRVRGPGGMAGAAWGAARWAAAEGTVVRGGSVEGREGAAGWTAGGARPWGPHVCLLEESPVLKRLWFAVGLCFCP